MKTTLIITIEHPDDVSANGLIEHAITPVLNGIDAEDGWSANYRHLDVEKLAYDIAMRFHLSDFPDDTSADDIQERMSDIVVWEPFEYWDESDVLESIDTLARDIEDTFSDPPPPSRHGDQLR